MSKKFRPSNGTEFVSFMVRWCHNCNNYYVQSECDIMEKTLVLDDAAAEYPDEWTYRNGTPVCTAFVPVKTPEQVRLKAAIEARRLKEKRLARERSRKEEAGQLRLFKEE